MGVVNAAPLDTFEPGLERYFNLYSLPVRSLHNHAVDRSTGISGLRDLAKEFFGKRAVRRLKRLIAILLELKLLQLHSKISGSGGAQDSLEAQDKAVVRQVGPA